MSPESNPYSDLPEGWWELWWHYDCVICDDHRRSRLAVV